jgi:poly-gamma-glutamate synthesis protein (capsule biosynthesis protein)
MTTIAAFGDIMPGGLLSGTDNEFISLEVKELLDHADIRVGTLETAIGNEPTFYPEKMARSADVIYAKDEDLKRLKELKVDIVSLANNHFFDLGPEGAVHAIGQLDELGIRHCGAGRNLEEASRPVVMEHDGKSYAFLSFCDWRAETVGWCPFATETEMGVNPMLDDYVVDQIQKNKKIYDYVIVIPHWGKEHSFVTTRHVYRLARKMKKAGADMIFGGHTHRIQPVLSRRNQVVAYSMGNFLFPDRLLVKPRSTYYPDEPLDTTKLPVTDRYPFVEETTLKIWKPLARIGMVVMTKVEGKSIKAQPYFVRMSKSNRLGICSLPFGVWVVMLWQKFFLSFMPYSVYEYGYSRMKKVMKRILK